LAQERAALILVDTYAPIEGLSYAMSTPQDLETTVIEVQGLGRWVHAAHGDVRDRTMLQDVVNAGGDQLARF
jgi:hypothetical protein